MRIHYDMMNTDKDGSKTEWPILQYLLCEYELHHFQSSLCSNRLQWLIPSKKLGREYSVNRFILVNLLKFHHSIITLFALAGSLWIKRFHDLKCCRVMWIISREWIDFRWLHCGFRLNDDWAIQIGRLPIVPCHCSWKTTQWISCPTLWFHYWFLL